MSGAPDLDDLELFREFAATKRRTTRNQLVERHMGLAAHIAKRYARGNKPDDDLRQVAMLGLVKAVDRFDPEHGASFSGFAGLTIEGELKRHFRDKSWKVRVPRSAKELHLLVRNATNELSQRSGRSPSVDEIAEHLGVERSDVLRGLAATAASNVGTLDTDTDDDGLSSDRRAALGAIDLGFERAEDVHVVEDLMAHLSDREREIVRLRFFGEKSQTEIAEIVGISQMHVSRLLRRAFEQMRDSLDAPDDD